MADRHEKPLSKIGNTKKIVDELEIPEVIKNYLALGPKHPVKDDFDELQFLVDIDALLHDMKAAGEPNEKLDEVNAQTLWYCKQMKKQRPDPMLKKVNTYLKRNGIKAVPFDKGLGFCLMKDETYFKKLDKILSDKQFQKARVTGNRDPVIQNEEKMNKKLRSLLKNGEIDKNL